MPAGSLSFPLLSPVAALQCCSSEILHKPETMKRAPWVYDVSRVTS